MSKLKSTFQKKTLRKKNIKNYFDNDQIIITDIDKNAYLSSLRLADHIVVTCDSTSMISEAAMTGKPIYVVQMPPVKKNERFQKFFRLFKSLNIIKDLENSLEVWSYEKLNETDRISSYIKKKFKDFENIKISNLPRPNFLAIDEGFGNLDSDNLDSIKSLFEHITSLFDFIIIITHIDYMKDIPDSLLEISVQDGYSYVAN